MKRYLTILALILTLPLSAQEEAHDISLTVYNSGYSMVRETRDLKVSEGDQWVKIRGVPSTIDPTSVSLFTPSQPGALTVLEQNYLYDLVNRNKLMEKYIDKTVILESAETDPETGDQKFKRREGTLLSTSGGIMLRVDGEVLLNPEGRIILPSLPGGLLTKPTLKWNVASKVEGNIPTRIRYMAGGLSWRADYNIIMNKEGTLIDLSSWVSLTNHSGATFNQAKIKLIAGDVNQLQHRANTAWSKPKQERLQEELKVSEKSFADYHMYELPGVTDLKASQLKQVEFLNNKNIKSKKVYVYTAGRGDKVATRLRFMNTKDNNMGVAMPKGVVRIYQVDADDNQLEFVGEDRIDHTPRDEEIDVAIGHAFDVVAETQNVYNKSESFRRTRTMGYEVTLKNRKKEAVTVELVIPTSYANWELLQASFGEDYIKKDATHIKVNVTLQPDEVKVTSYRLRYTW